MDINSPPPFEILLRVRYSECDAQQVVFNARYADYAYLAATEFSRVLLGGYQTLLSDGLYNQVVRLRIRWKNYAKFDVILCLSVYVSHVGNTSFSIQITMIDWMTKQAIASAEIVYVMLDIASFTKIAISQEMRDKLLKGANGKRTNMSGIEVSTQ